MPRLSQRYDGSFSAAKLARRNICRQALFYPRAVFEQYQFGPRYRVLADWALNMRCWHDGRFRFQYVPAVIAKLSDRAEISALRADDEFRRDYLELLSANFSVPVFLWRWAVRAAGWPLRVVGLRR